MCPSTYTLAEEHDKNQWLWAISGVLSYYVSAVFLGIIAALLYHLFGVGFDIEKVSDGVLTLVTIVVGLLSCWGFYYLLKSNWEKKGNTLDDLDDTILDDI